MRMRLRLINDKRRWWRKWFCRHPNLTSYGWTRTCSFTNIGQHINIISMCNYQSVGRGSGRADALPASEPPYPGSFPARGVFELDENKTKIRARAITPVIPRPRPVCVRPRLALMGPRPRPGTGFGGGANNIAIIKVGRCFNLPSGRI